MTRLHDAGPTDGELDGPVEPVSPESFVGAIPFGFDLSDDGLAMVGDTAVTDALRSVPTGPPRASVLATIADCIAGIPACLVTAPSLAVTLDIAVRMVGEHAGDRLDVAGEVVKRGRSVVAAEVRFTDTQTSDLVATSYVSFMASPRPQDLAPRLARGMRTTGSMPIPFPEFVGTRMLSAGVVEVDLTPFVMQASQSLQGGVVALIGEVASETLTGSQVLDLDIRYLSAVRVGPGRATATLLRADLVRVEVRDIGNQNRLAALIFARMMSPG